MRYDMLPQRALQYRETVASSARSTRVPEELIWAAMGAESDYYQDARSPVGAIGLMQLMPDTAKELGVDPYDAHANIRGGTLYLKRMLTRYGGNMGLALAAYNWGPGNLGLPARPESQWPHETQRHLVYVAQRLKRLLGGQR